jgi:hypothetical protein
MVKTNRIFHLFQRSDAAKNLTLCGGGFPTGLDLKPLRLRAPAFSRLTATAIAFETGA